MHRRYGDDAPIAALATAPGNSALSLIRCSGAGAPDIAANVFTPPKKLLEAAGNTVIYQKIVRKQPRRTHLPLLIAPAH